MKVAIYYFSGTGNTELTVKKWQSEAKKHNIEVDLFKIEEIKDEIDVSSYDKIGFGYPIHAFNAPRIVLKFAKKIKALEEKKPAFAVMVSGEYMNLNHSSHLKLGSILKHKNIFFESEYHYLMPYNMIFRHTEKRAFQMYETMNKLVELDVKDYLVDNIPHQLKKHKVFIRPFVWLLRIEQLFAPVNGKTFKINKKKCIKCMMCVKNCPTQNIEFKDGKFKFHNHCVLCTRCSFNCPTNAFSIGLLTGWKVNGKYKFKEPTEEEIDKHPRYCKKSYQRYYKEADERLSKQ